MVRQVINPNQTARKQYIEYPGDSRVGKHSILFCRDNGYCFSDDKEMDNIVNYFVSKKGFKLVGADKGSVSAKVENDTPKASLNKKSKKAQ